MLSRTSVQRPANVNDKKSFWNVETEEWVLSTKVFHTILAVGLTY